MSERSEMIMGYEKKMADHAREKNYMPTPGGPAWEAIHREYDLLDPVKKDSICSKVTLPVPEERHERSLQPLQ